MIVVHLIRKRADGEGKMGSSETVQKLYKAAKAVGADYLHVEGNRTRNLDCGQSVRSKHSWSPGKQCF
jgi:3-deoxy-D-arabino-heptulosonate 7-phosphate (DAHP) synthase